MNMTLHIMRRLCIVFVGGGLLGSVVSTTAGEESSLTGPATQDEIAALVGDLSHPSYEKRTLATRRLCAIGTPARERLRSAADGDDMETVLRARAILAVLDRLMFTDVEVRLAFAKAKIAWDEPTDLLVTMVNRSSYPARVPFEIDTTTRQRFSVDARQVGDMLDLADLVHVQSASGPELDLTVDNITDDPDVVAAVQDRLNGGPSGLIAPGQQVTVAVQAFNRGWARYRLLDKGTYTVRLDYVPGWNDEVLIAQRVGRVVSNEATITVTKSAPESVSRAGLQASLTLERRDEHLVVSLTNRSDHAMLINKDFGPSPPFAQGRWIWEADGTREETRQAAKPTASWHDFEATMLVDLPAGDSLELAGVGLGDLRRRLKDAGADLSDTRGTLHFGYVNACDRQWQVRQGPSLIGNPGAPPFFRSILPRQILSTRLTSPRLTASDLD